MPTTPARPTTPPLPTVLAALRAEGAALVAALSTFAPEEWARPTGCTPWSSRDLAGHVHVVIAAVDDVLDAPAPERAEVDAAGYYRDDDRFAPHTDAERIDRARAHAEAYDTTEEQVVALGGVLDDVVRRCEAQPEGRVVRTRHDDAMRLEDVLLTRVLEVAVHGLDLALAVGREPWTTPEAAALLRGLLLGGADLPDGLRWDDVGVLARLTGREAVTVDERRVLAEAGVAPLFLGGEPAADVV